MRVQNSVIDMTGQTIGPWTFERLAPAPPNAQKTSGAFWLVRCLCGETEVHHGAKLRAGRYGRGCAKCCGRGHSKRGNCSPTYNTWRAMRSRCLRPDDSHYAEYGGRGIAICDRWRGDFAQFLADMGERPKGKTLDRIDVNGPYTPENRRWADAHTQARNSRHFRLTDEQVAAIRRLLSAGAKQIDVALACGVARGHIANIATGHARAEFARLSTDEAMKEVMAELRG